jgi:cobalt-zinc-cadmium efflux system outer membrane protein
MNRSASSRTTPGPVRRSVVVALLVVGSACSSIPPDHGRSEVDALMVARGHAADLPDSAAGLDALVDELTVQPVTAQNAIRIALVNNPRLQAAYARLGYGAAEVYAAARIRNPVFGAALLDPDRSGNDQLTLSVVVSFTDLLTMSARRRIADAEFAALKQSIGAEVLDVAAATERAWYDYVAARQVVALRERIAHAAELTAELAQRFHAAGNTSARELAVEKAVAAQARLDALEAQAAAHESRRVLGDALGLSTGAAWQVLAALPLPAATGLELDTLLERAQAMRLDLAAARAQVAVVADRYGLQDWSGWIGELDVGVERERETDGGRLLGPTLEWEMPVFDQGGAELLRARADWQIATAELRRVAIAVDNDVRLAFAVMENAGARVARVRDVLLPERIAAVARAQEETNYMLIGVFELIGTKQQEYDAYQTYLEAVRDYWRAYVDLRHAVGGALPDGIGPGPATLDVDAILASPAVEADRSEHRASEAGAPDAHSPHAPHLQHGNHTNQGDGP